MSLLQSYPTMFPHGNTWAKTILAEAVQPNSVLFNDNRTQEVLRNVASGETGFAKGFDVVVGRYLEDYLHKTGAGTNSLQIVGNSKDNPNISRMIDHARSLGYDPTNWSFATIPHDPKVPMKDVFGSLDLLPLISSGLGYVDPSSLGSIHKDYQSGKPVILPGPEMLRYLAESALSLYPGAPKWEPEYMAEWCSNDRLIELIREQKWPIMTGSVPRQLHGLPEAHPYVTVVHDFFHIMRMIIERNSDKERDLRVILFDAVSFALEECGLEDIVWHTEGSPDHPLLAETLEGSARIFINGPDFDFNHRAHLFYYLGPDLNFVKKFIGNMVSKLKESTSHNKEYLDLIISGLEFTGQPWNQATSAEIYDHFWKTIYAVDLSDHAANKRIEIPKASK